MPTVTELTRDILSSIATDVGGIACAKWIDNRYKEMVSKVRFRHLRKVGELALPAIIDTGTVTTTRASTAVAGASTTFETDMSAGAQEYYYFKVQSAWNKIASVTDETNLVLSTGFGEAAAAAASYVIVKRHHPLASDARWVGDFYFTRLRKQLTEVPLEAIGIQAPGRSLTGNIPHLVAQVGVDSNGYPMYEIYPPPLLSEVVHYIYWALPTSLSLSTSIPLVIDPYTLKEGVLVDLYRYLKATELKKGNIEAAAVYRNDERAQGTIWKRAIQDAKRTSRGSDDLTFILEMYPGFSSYHDQRTARDYIHDNWSR